MLLLDNSDSDSDSDDEDDVWAVLEDTKTAIEVLQKSLVTGGVSPHAREQRD